MSEQHKVSEIQARWIWLSALLLGFLFDAFFWSKLVGISFPLYTFFCTAAGLVIIRLHGKIPYRLSLPLIAAIGFFSIMVCLRIEPLTIFLDILFTLFFMGLLASTAWNGLWLRFGFLDYIASFAKLILDSLLRPLIHPWRTPQSTSSDPGNRGLWQILPFLRGLLLAIPIILFFSVLLASADPVFSLRLQQTFNIDRLPEYLLRSLIIAFLTYLFVGIFLHALEGRNRKSNPYAERSAIPLFIGPVESTIIYLAVIILFTSFVLIQFQYFFGGQLNIQVDGYTYSEYARRGFFELIAVAFFSLMMFLCMHATTKRSGTWQRWLFTGLTILLMILVQVILYSALVRLNLYESAYGFSRLRTYAHVFLVWIGILFLIVVVLEIIRQHQRMALVFLAACVGFVVSLNLLNVDSFIVQQNVRLAERTGSLDESFLGSLSDDAVPVLRDSFAAAVSPLKEEIGASLACYSWKRSLQKEEPSWLSFHVARFRAEEDFASLEKELAVYTVSDISQGYSVIQYQGTEYSCGELFRD